MAVDEAHWAASPMAGQAAGQAVEEKVQRMADGDAGPLAHRQDAFS